MDVAGAKTQRPQPGWAPDHETVLDLTGSWRATRATDELRRVFADLSYDDGSVSTSPSESLGSNDPESGDTGSDDTESGDTGSDDAAPGDSGTADAPDSGRTDHRVSTDPAVAPILRPVARSGDNEQWTTVHVPSHWKSHAAFADNNDPLLFRRRFTAARPAPGRRSWLKFDGIFYQGDVWLDSTYVGDTEGYHLPHDFEITEQLQARNDHVLGVEVSCQPQNNNITKRNLTGDFQHSDAVAPDWNPGGIWQGVRIEETGPVRIKRLRCICLSASSERAELKIRALLDCDRPGTVRLRSDVGTTLHEFDHAVAKGSNRVEWWVTIERPKLWWPASLGQPNLTDVTISVFALDDTSGPDHTDMNGDEPTTALEPSDVRSFRTGLREVRMKNWIFTINGERLHLKGANVGPTRMAIGDATPAEVRRDVVLAQEAGLDVIRVHAHISHPALYDAADELGMLIWQDMPLQGGYARSVRKQAVRQAGETVDLLGHHPSIIHWCGHNEPLAMEPSTELPTGPSKKAAESKLRYALLQELPTWNKSVLDFAIHRALSKSDESRPVTAHSGIFPGPTSGGTDSHLSFGWRHGRERDLPLLLRAFPRMARFVSEFGAQALPVESSFIDSSTWPELDWDQLRQDRSLQKTFFDRAVPAENYRTFAEWKAATQVYQAELLRRQIEEFRRIKYRPNGGFAFLSLADPMDRPVVSTAVLGHDRQPKPAFEAVQEACRPVIVTIDRPPAVVTVGDALTFDVHVVSDVRHVLRGATVRAELRWPGGTHSWGWKGDVAADSCTRIGAIDFVVPSPVHPASLGQRPDRPEVGTLSVDLTLEHPETTATNRYTTRFV